MSIIDKFRYYFFRKRILWTSHVRIFCDGGNPIIRYFPKFRKECYAKYWNMKGFAVYWLGREFNFSFGKDINGLYKERGNYDK
jgi:hypothetical protein